MKTKIILSAFILSFMIHSCIPYGGEIDPEKEEEDDETEIIEGEEAKFLLLHQNDLGLIGEGSFISVLTVKDGETDYQTIELYPLTNLQNNVDINNERVVIGLHDDFNTNGLPRAYNGAWFDIGSNTWEILPLLRADDGRYAFFQGTPATVSKSGHVFYFASTNNSSYHDDNRYSLVRYNPTNKELKTASSPEIFALQQPELGPDTETADLEYTIFPSDDGRYVYGYASAYGLDGGSYHYDYKILCRYDFETDTYTRLGSLDETIETVIGMTADRQYLAYYCWIGNDYFCNLAHTTSNNIISTKLYDGQDFNNISRWNSSGYCCRFSSKIGVYNLVGNSYSEIRTQSNPLNTQYGKNSNQIYFMIDTADGKYLCKTSNNTPEATIDTICTLQANVHEFMVVR